MLAKISLFISIVLSILVGYLFYRISNTKHTPTDDTEQVQIAAAFSGDSAAKPVVVAYVNADTLNEKYGFLLDYSKDLESKMKLADARVREAAAPLQKAYDDNMRYAQEHPNMSESEANSLQQDMMRIEEEMNNIQNREVGALEKKKAELQAELMNRVHRFLEVYTKERGIDYVINYLAEVNIILYGNNAYDITNEVVAGLNAEYAAEKGKK